MALLFVVYLLTPLGLVVLFAFSDRPIGDRLVEYGVVTPEQLAAGTVQLGSVTHLGRLFERVPTLDRDPVEVVLELLTGEVARGLEEARERARHWHFKGHGFALIGPGLRRVYRDMRRDEAAARAEPTPARFHEWRKQTKYHANQLELLRAAAPKIFKGYRRVAEALADRLGEHHDLDALAAAIERADADRRSRKKRRVLAAMRRRNAKLEAVAFRLGDELAAEPPRAFLRRVEASWDDWRD